MLKNYLTIALRNLRRKAGHTFINVAGLAVGMACCLLILLFVQHEHSYDGFHDKGRRVYRMANDVVLPSGGIETGFSPLPHGPLVAEAVPEIVEYVRLFEVPTGFILANGDRRFEEPGLLFADASVFDVFTFPLQRGSVEEALGAPFTAVLTRSTARKYFGDADPIGETLVANGEYMFTVTGLLEDIPAASHIQFGGLLSIESARQMEVAYFEDRLNLAHATYFLTAPGTDPKALEVKINDVIDTAWGEGYRNSNIGYMAALEPLQDVYLRSARRGLGRKGDLDNLYVFSAIAVFTLVLACVNFVNLATARSAERAREVGMRKTLGAYRLQIAGQFLGESLLLTGLALALALWLVVGLLPLFNTLADRSLSAATLARPATLAVLAAGTIIVGVLAGAYPALLLSRFRPAAVLKGMSTGAGHGARLRKALVIFQFAVSVSLICGTGLVQRQLQYMQQQHLGFRTEQMLILDTQADGQVERQIDTIKRELARVPGVEGVAASDAVPGQGGWTSLSVVQTPDGDTREMMIRTFPVDFAFVDAYDLKLVAGRSFSSDFASDSTAAYLINETTRRELGYATAEDAVGKSYRQWGQTGQIVGVVEDFHFRSLKQAIGPLNLFAKPDASRYLTLRVATNDLSATVRAAEQTWARLVPHRPFQYEFLDESFRAQYRADQRFGQFIASFSLLATLVACLGLFGLASFTTQQRKREIGVRKVLGASIAQIVSLHSGQFARLVAVAFLIALPVSYFVMEKWLDDFAYRIEIGDQMALFFAAGLAVLAIALLTVSYQAIKAALTDPVKALRYE